jgi:diguanylate cyclase (GGDEF)-like protein/PAS domain S-box-containing protein
MKRDARPAEQEVEELLQFVYLMPVGIVRLGANGAVEMINPKAVQLLQDMEVDSGHVDGVAILDALGEGLAAAWRDSAGRVGAVMAPRRCSPPQPLGEPLHLLVELVRPDLRCTMIAIEDISATVEQERELARQRRRIGLVLEHIQGYCVAMLDAAGAVAEWNPSIGRLLGASEQAVVGQPLFNWLARDANAGHTPGMDNVQAAVAAQGWCRLEAPWRHRDGRVLWGDCVVTPVVESAGQTSGYVAVIRDVTEEHQRTQQLLGEALTDPLTGLHNRRGLEQQLAALAGRPAGLPTRMTWVMVDIDHFKRVNDNHGHDGGDAVLKAVAAAMQGGARGGDPLARMGGEEFVLLLPDAPAAVGFRVAERLRLDVQALAVRHAARSVHVTASFGVAEQATGETWIAALQRADAALYRAKNEGRNRVVLAEAASPSD